MSKRFGQALLAGVLMCAWAGCSEEPEPQPIPKACLDAVRDLRESQMFYEFACHSESRDPALCEWAKEDYKADRDAACEACQGAWWEDPPFCHHVPELEPAEGGNSTTQPGGPDLSDEQPQQEPSGIGVGCDDLELELLGVALDAFFACYDDQGVYVVTLECTDSISTLEAKAQEYCELCPDSEMVTENPDMCLQLGDDMPAPETPEFPGIGQ